MQENQGPVIEIDGQKYQLVITGEAEVIPGNKEED